MAQFWQLADRLRARAPDLEIGCGFIEFASPSLDEAVDDLVAGGAVSIVAVPLVLLGAGHLKDDGPAALAGGGRGMRRWVSSTPGTWDFTRASSLSPRRGPDRP